MKVGWLGYMHICVGSVISGIGLNIELVILLLLKMLRTIFLNVGGAKLQPRYFVCYSSVTRGYCGNCGFKSSSNITPSKIVIIRREEGRLVITRKCSIEIFYLLRNQRLNRIIFIFLVECLEVLLCVCIVVNNIVHIPTILRKRV